MMTFNQTKAAAAFYFSFAGAIGALCATSFSKAFAQSNQQDTANTASAKASANASDMLIWKELQAQQSDEKAATKLRDSDPKSIFAVVTQKGGLASALAHNHFIVAKDYKLSVEPGPSALAPAKVTVQFETKKLEVDPYELAELAAPRLLSLGLQHAKFSKLSESDRKTIAENMLAEDQLSSNKFQTIEAEASGFRPKAGKLGSQDSNFEADFVFKIRDKVVKKVVPLLITQSEAQIEGTKVNLIKIEGLVSERFQSFGFNAYSGLLGTVKNKDEFHFYIKSEGTWVKK